MTDATRIRTYPTEKEVDGIDTANQILWDLKGTFGWRAVGKINDGEVVEWVAYHNDIGEVVEWWPDAQAGGDPIWRKHSIYSFANGLKYHDEMALFEWPAELDKEAEVYL